MQQHSTTPRLAKSHRPRAACSLYTNPSASTTLPVYEDVTLTWDPACLSAITGKVDLYLNVYEGQDAGAVAVHEWTGVDYSGGQLVTQLQPSWWNASTGAGQVKAQLGMVASGSPIWDTAAPSGPQFTISYNGSYPSVTSSASSPVYTGPSVESVSDTATSSAISGGKLGVAIAIPLLVVLALVGAYVAWNKWKKRPEKKRWSAVIDQRMSMISQGTWAPPRGSTSSGRPGSQYSQFDPPARPSSHFSGHHRPSASIQRSPLAQSFGSDGRPVSNYFAAGANGSSSSRPVSGYSLSGTGGPRPSGEMMRQVGSGERVSRISFAASETSRQKQHGHSNSIASNNSPFRAGSAVRQSQYSHNALNSSTSSATSQFYGRPLPRTGSTKEDLLASAGGKGSTAPRKPSHLAKESITSSLQEADYPALAVIRDPSMSFPPPSPSSTSLASITSISGPFGDPHSPSSSATLDVPQRPELARAPSSVMGGVMPMADRAGMMSPDQLLERYAVKREPSGRATSPSSSPATSTPTSMMGRLWSGWGKKKTAPVSSLSSPAGATALPSEATGVERSSTSVQMDEKTALNEEEEAVPPRKEIVTLSTAAIDEEKSPFDTSSIEEEEEKREAAGWGQAM